MRRQKLIEWVPIVTRSVQYQTSSLPKRLPVALMTRGEEETHSEAGSQSPIRSSTQVFQPSPSSRPKSPLITILTPCFKGYDPSIEMCSEMELDVVLMVIIHSSESNEVFSVSVGSRVEDISSISVCNVSFCCILRAEGISGGGTRYHSKRLDQSLVAFFMVRGGTRLVVHDVVVGEFKPHLRTMKNS